MFFESDETYISDVNLLPFFLQGVWRLLRKLSWNGVYALSPTLYYWTIKHEASGLEEPGCREGGRLLLEPRSPEQRYFNDLAPRDPQGEIVRADAGPFHLKRCADFNQFTTMLPQK
jgi:hypothetical protein